jgi:predicted transcriptional regulator
VRRDEREARMNSIVDKVKEFLDDLAVDAVEERVVEYVTKELQNGRTLTEAINDPYVKNRLNEERVAKVFENPEILEALEAQISSFFKKSEFDLLG